VRNDAELSGNDEYEEDQTAREYENKKSLAYASILPEAN
jgi:hypothetical protein